MVLRNKTPQAGTLWGDVSASLGAHFRAQLPTEYALDCRIDHENNQAVSLEAGETLLHRAHPVENLIRKAARTELAIRSRPRRESGTPLWASAPVPSVEQMPSH